MQRYTLRKRAFSRPMTGHTPRKLPPCGRNLPFHRNMRAFARLNIIPQICPQVKFFLPFFHTYFLPKSRRKKPRSPCILPAVRRLPGIWQIVVPRETARKLPVLKTRVLYNIAVPASGGDSNDRFSDSPPLRGGHRIPGFLSVPRGGGTLHSSCSPVLRFVRSSAIIKMYVLPQVLRHPGKTRPKEDADRMKLGIVGLPNVGKSTLFNAITSAGAEAANYPFCTIDPNVGIVSVPDERLIALRDMYQPKKFTPAVIEFVDIAGLVKGASRGEGLGNRFLSNIRTTDAIVHVVRCFDDPNITHVEGSTDPLRDIEIVNMELVMADIEMVERRIEKSKKAAKGDRKFAAEAEVFERLLAHLNEGNPARTWACDEEEAALIATSDLLTLKKVIYAANLGEDSVTDYTENIWYRQVAQLAEAEGSQVLPICASLEAEIAELEEEEKAMFLEELGIPESGLDRLVKCSYALLGLISFLTAGSDECRAWTIKAGTRAPQAAGKIHTDFERGFIRAEVIAFQDLMACGSLANARAKGLIRSEGKEYVMQDGDVVNFLFNV